MEINVNNSRVETNIKTQNNEEIVSDINENNYNLGKNTKRKLNSIRNELNESETELSDRSYDINEEELSDNSIKVSANKKKFKSNKSEQQFKCDWSGCEKSYLLLRSLIKHQNIHKGKYLCDYPECGHRSGSLYDLKGHKRIHSNDKQLNDNYLLKEMRFKCEINECNKRFERMSSLSNHHLIAHPNQMEDFKWIECKEDNCNFRTKSKYSLRRHISKHNNVSDVNYPCDWEGCDYRAQSNRKLELHKLNHSNERQFKCELNDCNKLFKKEIHLRSHQLRVHPQELDDIEWIECSEKGCKYRTKLKDDFKKHEFSHTKPYICNICQKGFTRSNHLKPHMSLHSGNNDCKVQCEWYGCERVFDSNFRMKEHMNTHTAEVSHSCVWPNCDKTFINKQSLRMHMYRHKQLDYKCKWNGCEYQTTNPIRFKNHMNRHNSEDNV